MNLKFNKKNYKSNLVEFSEILDLIYIKILFFSFILLKSFFKRCKFLYNVNNNIFYAS